MSKRTPPLFPNETLALKTLGRRLSEARRARRLPHSLVAQRANLSISTLQAIEKGSPTAALGGYVAYTRALGMSGIWGTLLQEEPLTHDVAYNELPQRVRRRRSEKPTPKSAAAVPPVL